MKDLFEYCKNCILKEMPSGLIATPEGLDFDIGTWEHKSFSGQSGIYGNLRGKWCSNIINILIHQGPDVETDIVNFMDDNDYTKNGRATYLVYLIAIPTKLISETLVQKLSNQPLTINKFLLTKEHGEYTIFVNEFVKYFLFYD